MPFLETLWQQRGCCRHEAEDAAEEWLPDVRLSDGFWLQHACLWNKVPDSVLRRLLEAALRRPFVSRLDRRCITNLSMLSEAAALELVDTFAEMKWSQMNPSAAAVFQRLVRATMHRGGWACLKRSACQRCHCRFSGLTKLVVVR